MRIDKAFSNSYNGRQYGIEGVCGMNWLNRLEHKFGRYAVRNLPAYIIAFYAAGYLISMLMPRVLEFCLLEPAYILQGQIWRIVTWILVPPSDFGLFTLIMLYFYYSLGKVLERTWGAFRFNVYIFSGMLFTILGAFILYFILMAVTGNRYSIGYYFSTYYINMSIFLAFTLSYPDMQVMLYFLIPIKVKWMGIIYGALLLYDMIRGGWPTRVAILASMMNFLIFFLSTRGVQRMRPGEIHRRAQFKRKVTKMQPRSGTIHKCAVCGRTEKDGEHLEFRFCSKCSGNYEYCQDHLFTHQHR